MTDLQTSIVERAPAKINLYLHVTGKREDGYHLLDSLVVFADQGDAAVDEIELTPSDAYQLRITGPQAALLKNERPDSNLITRALRSLGAKVGRAAHFDVMLTKRLPVASGIGGGSADAAAALRAAANFYGLAADDEKLLRTALEIGADVTACVYNKPCYFSGIGDEIEVVDGLPHGAMLLVNPNIPLPTPHVFKARSGDFHAAARFPHMPKSMEELAAMLAARSNDLQAPAILLCEAIADVLAALDAQKGCLLSRLSGSGATCFGLFNNAQDAEAAAATIRRQVREWWVAVSGF